MSIKPQKYDDYQTMCSAVADRVIGLVQAKPNAVIGIATGKTPEGVYAEICKRVKAAEASGHPIDFSKAQFFALDEYVGVSAHDPISYHYYLWEKLLGPIKATPELVHIPQGDAKPPEKGCADYEAALAKAGKVDLWLVGLGMNGHVAFNEPGTSLASRTHVVDLTEDTRAVNSVYCHGNTPYQAITVGLGTIKQYAKEVAFMVDGEAKADILSKAMYGGVTSNVPASILQTMNTTGYFSSGAASKLHQKF